MNTAGCTIHASSSGKDLNYVGLDDLRISSSTGKLTVLPILKALQNSEGSTFFASLVPTERVISMEKFASQNH